MKQHTKQQENKKVNCDLEKSKIELVRDALKDTIDTIRAQDRKASYMIAIVFFMVSAYSLITSKKHSFECISSFQELIHFYPIIYLLLAVGFLFFSYNPVLNPVKVLTDEDIKLGKNKLFVLYTKDKENSSDKLADDFIKSTKSTKNILKLLYIEILKLSKIRDRKISYIKFANPFIFTGLVSAIAQIITLYQYSDILLCISIVFLSIYLVYIFCKRFLNAI